MYDLLKKLGENSAFYTFANAIEALSPFLLAVILTRELETTEYGVWVLFIALVTFLRPLVNLSIQDALRMEYYDMNDVDRAQFIWSALCLTTLCTGFFIALALSLPQQLSLMLSLPTQWLAMIPVAAYLYANFYFILAFNQFANERRRFLTLHVVQTTASLLLIAFLVLADWGWPGVVVGKVGGLLVGCATGAFWVIKSVPIGKVLGKVPDIIQLSKFGLLYLPTGMGMVAIPLTDRLVVTHVLGLSENGLYGVAALFGAAVFVAINGILHAWMPWLSRSIGERRHSLSQIVAVSLIFFLLLPIGGVAAYACSVPLAPIMIGDEFEQAFPLIPWAIAGSISMGYFFHNQAFLLFKKSVLLMSISSFSCIVLNVVLSYFGAIRLGLVGVLAATIAAFLIAAILSATFAIRQYRPEHATT